MNPEPSAQQRHDRAAGRARVPFIAPAFPDASELAHDYEQILASNWYTNFGAFENDFRDRLAEYVGPGASAVTFCNATAALQAAMLACFPGPPAGRLVVMPSFTFAAAAQVVRLLGFRPLFVDIELAGLHADPAAAAQVVAASRAEIAGILFGNSFGVGAHHIAQWEALAAEHGLSLVIDSAAGFGSRYEDGSRLGRRGDCEIFSFHATKPLAVGEGGAIITRDPDLAQRLRRVSNFGFVRAGVPVEPGFNGKLAEIPAAIGLRQLGRLDDVIAARAAVLEQYRAALPAVSFARNAERSALAFVSVLLPDGTDRDELLRRLADRGIEARSYYAPSLHKSALFARDGEDLTRTEEADRRVLSLPCHALVSSEVVDEISSVVNEVCDRRVGSEPWVDR